MPTYDYRCKFCEHTLEVFQNLSEKKLRKCPGCGRPGLQRLIGTGGGIVFKGSGFYETDYRSSGYKADAKADTKQDAGKDGSGGAPKTSGSDGPAKPTSGSGSDSGSGSGSDGGKGGGGKSAPKAGGGSADKGKS